MPAAFGRLGDRGVELALAWSGRAVTGSLGVMLAMFQWLRSRIAAMVVRVVPISLLIWPSVTSGWFLMIQAMPSGLSWRLETGV